MVEHPMARCKSRNERSEDGFTLIELLVVIIILGVLSAVVVFAVRGAGDKGEDAARAADERTLRTAQEAHCAQFGSYATSDQQLVDARFLSEVSTMHEVIPGGFRSTSCGSYDIDAQKPGFGQASQVDVVKLASFPSPNPGGFPSPFAFGQGPGFNNMHYIFDTLTWKDASGRYLPWLAKDLPTITADGRTVTYTLRDGVQFSNGDPLTANDVTFTFDYIRPGGTYSAGAGIPGSFYYSLEYISGVAASGANPAAGIGGTVTFSLTAPFVPFEALIGSRVPILPETIWSTVTSSPQTYGSPADPNRNEVVGGKTRAERAVIGSGPYTLENPGAFAGAGVPTYAFVAKAGTTPATSFFLGTPFVRRLEYVPGGSNHLATLQNGTIDAASAPDGVAPPASLNSFGRIEAPGENVRALHFNMRTGGSRTGANVSPRSFPYDQAAFRQAVAYALDRKQLLANVLGGLGEVGSMGALAPSNAFANPTLPSYERDLIKAAQLLDSLDIKDTNVDGDNLRELPCSPTPCTRTNFTPTIRSQAASSDTTNPLVDGYFSDIGIDAVIEAGVAIGEFTNGNYDIGLLSYGAMGAEPDQLRTRLSSTDPLPQFTDVYGWSNSEFETLAYQQVSDQNATSRRQKLFRMQELAAQEVPLISLYLPKRTWLYSSKPVPWYFTPGGLWAGWPGAPSKQLFVVGRKTGLPTP